MQQSTTNPSFKEKSGYSKSEIYQMYPGVPKHLMRQYMNEIIKEQRKIPADNVTRIQVLLPIEFTALKSLVGEPNCKA